MELNEAKILLKEAIDEADSADDIFRIFVNKVYRRGYWDKIIDQNFNNVDKLTIHTKQGEDDNEEMQKKKLEKLRLEKMPSPNNTMIISPHKCPICDYYLYVDGAGRLSKKEHYCLNCGFTVEIDMEE